MITYSVNKQQLADILGDISSFKRGITSPNLQSYRANKYRQFTISKVQDGGLDLKPITQATIKIQGKEHPPEWNTGTLLNKMSVRPVKKDAADVGYFADDKELIPNKKITWTQAAILQHVGYRIPLTGPKGAAVMAFFKKKGLFKGDAEMKRTKSKGKKWIHVAPRPFMYQAYFEYMMDGHDIKAADAFLDSALKGKEPK